MNVAAIELCTGAVALITSTLDAIQSLGEKLNMSAMAIAFLQGAVAVLGIVVIGSGLLLVGGYLAGMFFPV